MKNTFRVLFVVMLAFTVLTPVAKADYVALNAIFPENLERFKECIDAAENEMCYQNFTWDQDLDGIFEPVPTDSELCLRVWISNQAISPDYGFYATMHANVASSGWADCEGGLSEILTSGVPLRYEINTRDWNPRGSNISWGQLEYINRELIGLNWITSVSIVSQDMTFEDNHLTGDIQRKYDAIRAYVMFLNESNFREQASSFQGYWISTNLGSYVIPVTNNPLTLIMKFEGPATRTDGETPYLGYMSIFIPDTLIINGWGSTPEALPELIQIIHQESGEKVDQPFSWVRIESSNPGIRIDIRNLELSGTTLIPMTNAAPLAKTKSGLKGTLTIKPKTKPLSIPKSVKLIKSKRNLQILSDKVLKAKKYQVNCFGKKGNLSKIGKKPNLTFKGLAKGKWSCRIRAINQYGGFWSVAKSVKIT